MTPTTARTLLIVDIQNDNFEGGAMPLVGADRALGAAKGVVASFRQAGDVVIHVQHIWDDPEATFMRPGTRGVDIHDDVRPLRGETVITKESPNAFLGTRLAELLGDLATQELVVLGMMTSMCVDSTVRAAAELGFEVTLVHDACAAPDLTFEGETVGGAAVHAAFVAALGDGFATVRSSKAVIG
jgi:nicotinamidase-related amidase